MEAETVGGVSAWMANLTQPEYNYESFIEQKKKNDSAFTFFLPPFKMARREFLINFRDKKKYIMPI